MCVTARRLSLGLAMLALALNIVSVPQAARAAFPGRNGKIVLTHSAKWGFGHLYLASSATGRTRIPGLGEAYDAAWSPDGTKIAFAGGPSLKTEIYDFTRGQPADRVPYTVGSNSPSWSPDGSHLVYWVDYPNYKMFSIGVDGTDKTDLGCCGMYPAYSPDGSKIAFTSAVIGSVSQIMVMNSDGTNAVALTNHPYGALTFDWSPDGARLAYASFASGDLEIWAMNDDGSNQTQLTHSPGDDWMPSWSPDGSKIAFISHRTGRFHLFEMKSDGAATKQVTFGRHSDFLPDWQAI